MHPHTHTHIRKTGNKLDNIKMYKCEKNKGLQRMILFYLILFYFILFYFILFIYLFITNVKTLGFLNRKTLNLHHRVGGILFFKFV